MTNRNKVDSDIFSSLSIRFILVAMNLFVRDEGWPSLPSFDHDQMVSFARLDLGPFGLVGRTGF